MEIFAHQGEAKSQNHKIFKSLYLAQFLNLFSKFLHVSCYYTNQQVVYGDMGSNMVPLGGTSEAPSRGRHRIGYAVGGRVKTGWIWSQL